MNGKGDRHLFELQAEICKTMADPTRLMLLHELSQGERSVGQLVNDLGLRQANVSRHLAILRDRKIVLTRREGTTIYYRLASPQIAQACGLVREVLESQLVSQQAMIGSLRVVKSRRTGGHASEKVKREGEKRA